MKTTLNRSRRISGELKPRIIKTKAQYKAAMTRVEQLFTAKPGTAAGDELELLLLRRRKL